MNCRRNSASSGEGEQQQNHQANTGLVVRDPEEDTINQEEEPPELVADDPEVLLDESINQKFFKPPTSLGGYKQAIHHT